MWYITFIDFQMLISPIWDLYNSFLYVDRLSLQYFFKSDFCIYVHKRLAYRFLFLKCLWFWYQDKTGLRGWVGKCSLLLSRIVWELNSKLSGIKFRTLISFMFWLPGILLSILLFLTIVGKNYFSGISYKNIIMFCSVIPNYHFFVNG